MNPLLPVRTNIRLNHGDTESRSFKSAFVSQWLKGFAGEVVEAT